MTFFGSAPPVSRTGRCFLPWRPLCLSAAVLTLSAPGILAAKDGAGVAPPSDVATLALRDLDGANRDLKELRGQIVLLNFWATWCLPCREEMPVFVSIRKRYAARGVHVIAASTDLESARSEVARFARDKKLNFPVWVEATTEDMSRLGAGAAIPATVIIDRDGTIAGRIIGVVEKEDLERRVEWLLSDRSTPAPPATITAAVPHGHEHEPAASERKETEGAEEGQHHEGEEAHEHEGEDAHEHEGEEEHQHGGVGMEGASLVPS